jgi:FixJ family two-component response regulator
LVLANILVVDDRPENRDLLTFLLASRGHDVRTANNGSEALDAVKKGRPDLVICDILMPSMDGYEFVRRLREQPDLAGTPVIFTSAHYSGREAMELAKDCGVPLIIPGPIEPEEFLAIVDEFLSRARHSEAPRPTVSHSFVEAHCRLLTDRLAAAQGLLHATKCREADARAIVNRIATLTERERAVFLGLVAGKLGKEIASELGLSPRTVEVYRAKAMKKLCARTTSDLIRMGLLVEIYVPDARS